MRFHQRTYVLYLILGTAGPRPLYEWATWKDLVPALDPLVGAARGQAGVHSSQIDRLTRQSVPFGKLGWNRRGHMRWTHHSPDTVRTSHTWLFESTQIYAPHWPTCVREDAAPDVYIHLHAPASTPDTSFTRVLLMALHVGLPQHILEHAAPSAATLAATLMQTPLVAMQESPWGQTSGNGFIDIIQSCVRNAGPAREHADPQGMPDISMLPGQWRSFRAP